MSTSDECNCDACRAMKQRFNTDTVVEAIDTFRDANELEALSKKLDEHLADMQRDKMKAMEESLRKKMAEDEKAAHPIYIYTPPPLSAVDIVRAPQRGETLFTDAAKTINGERQTAYGDPEDSFDAIAVRWTQYMRGKGLLVDGPELVAADVAFMMADFKMARECFQGKRDNLVDAVGYLGILDDLRASS